MPSVYLAGPIAGKSFKDAVTWRDEMTQRLHGLGYDVYAPMRATRADLTDLALMPLEEDTFTFQRDAYDIQRSDMLLVNWLGTEVISIGTAVEMGMAYAQNKFVVTVIEHPTKLEYPLAKDGKYHPFITGTSNIIVHNLDRALAFFEASLPATPPKVQLQNWPQWMPPMYGEDNPLGEYPVLPDWAEMFSEQAEYLTTEREQLLLELENEVES